MKEVASGAAVAIVSTAIVGVVLVRRTQLRPRQASAATAPATSLSRR